MALDTYTGLVDTVIAYAFRSGDADFAAAVPTFIQLTESRLNRSLRVSEMEATAQISTSYGGGYLPDDFLEARRLHAGSPSIELQLVSPGWAGDTYPTTPAGPSRFATIVGGRITPYPSGTGPISLTYYAKIPALTEDNPTNWVLEKAPELYLYGCLTEAAPFMMDDSRIQGWMTLFLGALKELRGSDAMGRFSLGSARVSGPTP